MCRDLSNHAVTAGVHLERGLKESEIVVSSQQLPAVAAARPTADAPAPHPVLSAARSAPRGQHRGLVLLVIAGVSLLVVLNATMVNVALPSMGRYLHRGPTDMTWVVNISTIAFAGLLLPGGRAGDLFGRRRTLVVGLGLFTLGALGAGLATSFDLVLVGRLVQGVGAAAAAPTALALIATEFEQGQLRNRAIAVYAAVSGAGLAAGVLLGGILTTYLSWRWVLLVNVPVGLLLIALTWRCISESERSIGRIDIFGSLASVAGVAGLVYGCVHAGQHGWSNPVTLIVLFAALALLAAFAMYEAFVAAEPIMAMRIFWNRNRSGAYLVVLLSGASLFAMFYLLTYFIQDVLGYSALKTGCALLPATAVLVFAAQLCAKLLPRVGPKLLVVTGTALLGGALLWLSRIDANSRYLTTVLPAIIVVALGLGAILVPLTCLVMLDVNETDSGLASALLNVGQQVGGALGLAVVASTSATAALNAGTAEGFKLVERYGLGEHLVNFLSLAKSVQAGTTPPRTAALDPIAHHAINVAQAHGYAIGLQTTAVFGGAAIIAAILGLRRRGGRAAAAAALIEETLADETLADETLAD
jgi:EmrB/QacA subfamily drug resistance transporter